MLQCFWARLHFWGSLPLAPPWREGELNDDYDNDYDLFVHRDTETQSYFDYDYDDDFFVLRFSSLLPFGQWRYGFAAGVVKQAVLMGRGIHRPSLTFVYRADFEKMQDRLF